ncbi:uncharacterized protein [Antedon mediterranea]|uniref:uncharacterized protein n=1 Tax=Antedon mediterranea TaxID=105859 RepID=UPI003AF55A4C
MPGQENFTKRKLGGYTRERVEIAVRRIRNGEISVRSAAKLYQIPKPDPYLTVAEENKVVEWLKSMARIGYGRTHHELKLTVKEIVESDGRETPFKDNMPGRQWQRNFMKRHPDLAVRLPESLGVERAAVSKEKIAGWFEECQRFIAKEKLEEAFADPTRLYNVDETGFPLGVKNERVLAAKGAKDVFQQTSSTRHQITVVGGCNAAGSFIPPLIIFPGVRFGYNPLEGAPEHSSFAKSKTGWVNSEIFFEYISNHFLPYVKSLNVSFPIVLFVDGHASHINIETAELCVREKIVLYCLPSHSSHLIQPLDVAVYKTVKASWGKAVRGWMIDHPGQYVTKQSFASVFGLAWEEGAKKEHAVSGFRKSGLYPFNPDAIDQAKLAPSSVFHRTEPLSTAGPSTPITSKPNQPLSAPTTPSTRHSPARPTSSKTASLSSSSASKVAALRTFEAAMGEATVSQFQRRQMEGYDIPDHMYETWLTLRSGPSKTRTPLHPHQWADTLIIKHTCRWRWKNILYTRNGPCHRRKRRASLM